MLKKLDKLILKSFLGPFIVTFFIAFFVLMMQTLWKYIDDLVGKGLDFVTIMKFVWYASATLSSLAMPIAILISSIMTFGNLGESFELVAIKASGISLLRFMRPLIWVTLLLCMITFVFANYVIPYSNLKFITLYQNILVTKPTLELKEGIFYTGIEKYAIKVDNKEMNGNISNALIYDQTNNLQENTIIAEKGKMVISPDDNFLEFNLENGTRYQEKGNFGDSSTEYVRLQFKTFKKLFDLSAFKKSAANEDALRNNYKMLNARQLNKNIDSLVILKDSLSVAVSKTLKFSLPFLNDSMKTKKVDRIRTIDSSSSDGLFPDSAVAVLFEKGITKVSEMKNTLMFTSSEAEMKRLDIIFHKLEWQRKFAFSLACMVLFFIGAPLGSIIRKGGMGMPLVVAIIFFLIFHLLNMFGEKFVRNEILPPFTGMWLAVIVLTPVGFFFTYKAMHDSQLFNKEFYTRSVTRLKSYLQRKKKPALNDV